jgi:hypothetical protein
MKFLKQKNISKFSITDQTLFTNHYGRAVMGLSGGLRLPHGTTAQRPQTSGVRYPGDASEFADGTIRYNIDTNSLEALIAGVWEVVRAPGATTITKQTLGPGDGTETVFGPLNSTAAFVTAYSASADNILVLVENVMQISTTNFSVQQSVSGSLTGPNAPYADGWYVKFTSAVPATGGGGNPVYVTVYYGYAN